jgi:hypothetical protein
LNKELGLAYIDPYWYRLNNGLRTRAQAVQVQQYYNQPTLPPYGKKDLTKLTKAVAEKDEGSQGAPGTRGPLNSAPPAAPTPIIIPPDHDKTLDAQGQLLQPTAQVTSEVDLDVRQQIGDTGDGLGITATIRLDSPEVWQQDAVTMTEEAYIIKHYAKAAAPTSGVTMDMYLGLCSGQVLSASLLLAATDVHLQKKWKGMRCRNLTVKTQPQANGQCSEASLRSRADIRSTEALCIPTSRLYTTMW